MYIYMRVAFGRSMDRVTSVTRSARAARIRSVLFVGVQVIHRVLGVAFT